MAKPATIKIRLNSSADTGFFYVTKKNPRTQTEKLVLKKYDPVVRKHVDFKEGKIKYAFLPIGKNRIEKARSDAPGLLLWSLAWRLLRPVRQGVGDHIAALRIRRTRVRR